MRAEAGGRVSSLTLAQTCDSECLARSLCHDIRDTLANLPTYPPSPTHPHCITPHLAEAANVAACEAVQLAKGKQVLRHVGRQPREVDAVVQSVLRAKCGKGKEMKRCGSRTRPLVLLPSLFNRRATQTYSGAQRHASSSSPPSLSPSSSPSTLTPPAPGPAPVACGAAPAPPPAVPSPSCSPPPPKLAMARQKSRSDTTPSP